jgi:hypothetical protein
MEHEFQFRIDDKDHLHKYEMENIKQECIREIAELKTKEQENYQFLEKQDHNVS